MISKLLQNIVESETATLPSSDTNALSVKSGGRATHTTVITHFELARTLERANRRFASFLQAEMTRRGVQEIGPAHAMLLLTIGHDELSVGQLMDRGPYGGTNLSYYLKQLGECGYIERIPLARDRRTARIRLSEKARQLCDDLTEVAAKYHRLVAGDPENIRNIEVAFATLDRLERAWATAAIFGPPSER
ncbi:MarR family transcriptional regulator [Phyllobacterium brassicacearum]|uniref:MarR family transcriptional regulator n=1 Tax=Phyllobacterium brassicacearum TaxID=314235 RepID=A0A2P7BRF5_9HYPH|nr:winged helix DNA-binding protein [Phyllobacterium brassicacearum]PSH69043.1 MarR family transcriptional regulator [Phyllobacterium brassicacearum]TDQ25290.1 DNA-binding MarR family transcriptional regulator [Phyllobacterium brassicacearum]